MAYTEDGYSALMLTMALSPDQPADYARPYGAREFWALEAKVRASQYGRLSALQNADVSGLMLYLGLPMAEAVRLHALVNNAVVMMYALERLLDRGVFPVTCYDAAYPQRLRRRLGVDAPPILYLYGNAELLNAPAVAVMGMPGVRTVDREKRAIEVLADASARQGFALFTTGEPGVSRAAADAADSRGGRLIEALAGGMREHIEQPAVQKRLDAGRSAVISLAHPDVLLAPGLAAARGRLMFALSDAAFIFNADGRRGESEAIQNRTCAWIYAFEGRPENRPLIARGAAPFSDVSDWDFETLSRRWRCGDSEQLSIFDML